MLELFLYENFLSNSSKSNFHPNRCTWLYRNPQTAGSKIFRELPPPNPCPQKEVTHAGHNCFSSYRPILQPHRYKVLASLMIGTSINSFLLFYSSFFPNDFSRDPVWLPTNWRNLTGFTRIAMVFVRLLHGRGWPQSAHQIRLKFRLIFHQSHAVEVLQLGGHRQWVSEWVNESWSSIVSRAQS